MSSTPQFEADQRLDSYRLVRPLGSGGFSQVWLAVDEGPHGFHKKVALKLLSGGQNADRDLVALINEARVGCHLRHPNLVDMYRMDSVDGAWFIAMEYVEGRDLRSLLQVLRHRNLRLPPSTVLDIGLAVARGLAYAHAAVDNDGGPLNLVHRDIKPANVMLARTGAVKVADFGISKASTSDQTETATGLYKGTPAYSAPEVWRGERPPRPRSDLFSMGAMLWEMAVGKRLFDGDSAPAVATQVLFGDPEKEVAELAWLFPPLAPLVRDLLKRDAEARIQTAEVVIEELAQLRRGVDAPGDLELLLRLVEVAELEESARPTAIGEFEPPETTDDSWRQLFSVARGLPVELAPTECFALPVVAPPAPPVPEPVRPVPMSAPVAPASPARTPPRLAPILVLGAVLLLWLWGRPHDSAPVDGAETAASAAPEPDAFVDTPQTEPGPAQPELVEEPVTSEAPTFAVRPPVAATEALPKDAPAPPATEEEATPETSPEEVAEVPPPPSTGCVVFSSRTPGERVRLNGRTADFVGSSSRPVTREFPPGVLHVEMGEGDDVARVDVDVEAGSRLVVDCDLLVRRQCDVRVEEGGCP